MGLSIVRAAEPGAPVAVARAAEPATAAIDDDLRRRFESAAREHEPTLLAIAMRLSRNRADARDLVQDTLEHGLRRFDRIRPDSNVRGWLIAIQHNLFIDHCRRGARRKLRSIAPGDDVPAPEPSAPPRWTEISGDQLRAALAGLGVELRVVYQMHALERRSYDDIARALGIPKATVGTRLLRARRRLRAALIGDAGGGHEEDTP